VVLIELGFIRSPFGTVNVALMDALGHTPTAPTVGLVDATVIYEGGVAVTVVKVHT
jgi:hypothetical protein